MLELPDGVVDAPHEDREERVVTAEKFSLGMFHFKSFSFCFGEALHNGSLVHTVAGPTVEDSLKDDIVLIRVKFPGYFATREME